jgi:hypothetical protein
LRGGHYNEEKLVQEVNESDFVDLFSTILNSGYATQTATNYMTAVTAACWEELNRFELDGG